MTAKKLGKLLNPSDSGGLQAVVARAASMGKLTTALQQALPDEACNAIVAANLRDDKELIVIASTPAWASRLRFEVDTLLDAARSSGLDATTCRVRVSQSGGHCEPGAEVAGKRRASE